MKLERNVRAKERTAVVRHVQHRKIVVGKTKSRVRVRGHKINMEKLSRWIKEAIKNQSSLPARPPSRKSKKLILISFAERIMLISTALPSCISIYTNSICGSPRLSSSCLIGYQQPGITPIYIDDSTNDVMERILRYAQDSRHHLESQKSRSILNDFQTILSDICISTASPLSGTRGVRLERDIVKVRNLMNLAHELTVMREWDGMCHDGTV
jgi:hypothetical protein